MTPWIVATLAVLIALASAWDQIRARRSESKALRRAVRLERIVARVQEKARRRGRRLRSALRGQADYYDRWRSVLRVVRKVKESQGVRVARRGGRP